MLTRSKEFRVLLSDITSSTTNLRTGSRCLVTSSRTMFSLRIWRKSCCREFVSDALHDYDARVAAEIGDPSRQPDYKRYRMLQILNQLRTTQFSFKWLWSESGTKFLKLLSWKRSGSCSAVGHFPTLKAVSVFLRKSSSVDRAKACAPLFQAEDDQAERRRLCRWF